jgi:hypothetical protein
MSTIAQDNSVREELQGYLKDLMEIDISSLSKKEELGAMNFELGLPVFERSLRLYRELSNIQLDAVGPGMLNQARDRAREAVAAFKQIREFSFTKYPTNTQSQRDSLITTMQDRYDAEFTSIAPIISYGTKVGTDFQRLEREAKSKLDAMNLLLTDDWPARCFEPSWVLV